MSRTFATNQADESSSALNKSFAPAAEEMARNSSSRDRADSTTPSPVAAPAHDDTRRGLTYDRLSSKLHWALKVIEDELNGPDDAAHLEEKTNAIMDTINIAEAALNGEKVEDSPARLKLQLKLKLKSIDKKYDDGAEPETESEGEQNVTVVDSPTEHNSVEVYKDPSEESEEQLQDGASEIEIYEDGDDTSDHSSAQSAGITRIIDDMNQEKSEFLTLHPSDSDMGKAGVVAFDEAIKQVKAAESEDAANEAHLDLEARITWIQNNEGGSSKPQKPKAEGSEIKVRALRKDVKGHGRYIGNDQAKFATPPTRAAGKKRTRDEDDGEDDDTAMPNKSTDKKRARTEDNGYDIQAIKPTKSIGKKCALLEDSSNDTHTAMSSKSSGKKRARDDKDDVDAATPAPSKRIKVGNWTSVPRIESDTPPQLAFYHAIQYIEDNIYSSFPVTLKPKAKEMVGGLKAHARRQLGLEYDANGDVVMAHDVEVADGATQRAEVETEEAMSNVDGGVPTFTEEDMEAARTLMSMKTEKVFPVGANAENENSAVEKAGDVTYEDEAGDDDGEEL